MQEAASTSAGHMRLANHRLAQADFDALADGAGTPAGLAQLSIAERSKHILLIHELLVKAGREYPAICAGLHTSDAFRLLVQAEECEPEATAHILSLPGVGAWAVDCLLRLGRADREETVVRADLAQFNAIAAASGLRTQLEFMLPVRLRDGRLVLPGFGPLGTSLRCEYAVLRHSATGTALLDGGSEHGLPSPLPPRRQLTFRRADTTLDVHFDVSDPYLGRHLRHPLACLDEATAEGWTDRLAGAWRILADNHAPDAAAIVAFVNTVVPLTVDRATHNVSATSTAAFGAIAASLPPDDVTLAETLVHECQHLKLCALLDLFPMIRNDWEGLYYVPWRDDPRPLRGLLQGACAYFGVTRFWREQRHHGSSREALRGHVEFARRRSETLAVTRTLLHSGGLTASGVRFAARMHGRLSGWRRDSVPAEARRMAAEVSAYHAALWRLRHLACDPDLAGQLAKSWEARAHPGGELPDAVLRLRPSRTGGDRARSSLLTLRYTDPERFRALLSGRSGSLSLGPGDLAFLRGDRTAAIAAYRAHIRDGAAPPESWAGLVAAIRTMKGNSVSRVLLTWAPLLFAVHSRAENADPLELAAWLAECCPRSPI